MARVLGALLAGVLFGLGLAVSQMVNPAKVLGFLDVAGAWDASLAFVMGGALAVLAVAYRYIFRFATPLLDESFRLPDKRAVDRRLVAGSIIFGIGWGLVGLCPGPTLAALAYGKAKIAVFALAMAAGALAYNLINRSTIPGGRIAGNLR